MTSPRIILIRHGRSGHVVQGLLDHAAFLKWREAYEAAGIDPTDLPPPDLCAVARSAGIVVSSDGRRAIESAHALAPDREVTPSPLLRELSLHPPHLPRVVRLPLLGWALTFALRWLFRRAHATPEEHHRAQAAAQWLIALSAQHGDVIAVTHASFRSLLARELTARSWTPTHPHRRSSHWSAWSFTH